MSDDQSRSPYARAVVPLFAAFQLLLLANAWLCDDAFITLRTIDNLVHGDGLRYNVDERVQAYTHPLWLGVLSIFYSFTEEPYYTTVFVSLLCSSFATYVLVFKVSHSYLHAIAVLATLSFSKSFVEFSTSGLENPLTHLLLGVFFWLAMGGRRSRREVLWLSLVAGLGMLNRLDAVFFFLPPLLLAAWPSLRWRSVAPVALGATPLVAWEVFSLLYYGSLFPNTFYAKLGAGIPRHELLEQGVYYWIDSLTRDPATIALIVSASALFVVSSRDRTRSAFVLGMALYCAYTLAIGGDFMSGRFLSPACYLAALLLASARVPILTLAPALAFCCALGLAGRLADRPEINAAGIADERAFYASVSSLAAQHRNAPVRSGRSAREGVRSVKLLGSIGIRGYQEGPDVHVIDILGLADPLLARLPSQDRKVWRIGHFERKLPAGYWETLETGRNQIEDQDLAAYYDRLSAVTRGRIWSWDRLVTIVQLHLGLFDPLIDVERYRKPYSETIRVSRLGELAPGGVRLAPRNGVLIDLEGMRHCAALDVELEGEARYRLVYYLGEEPVASHGSEEGQAPTYFHRAPFTGRAGLESHAIRVPQDVADAGYDGIMVYPVAANDSRKHRVGRIELCEEPRRR